uniref:mucin-3A-like n=1 Tax=Semicossyphus pulcher TaxID=241346 RepID=UPI0037E740CB
MLNRSKLSILLQGLALLLLGPACQASSLGMTVHVVPLKNQSGETVRAHFSAIAPAPCPDLTGLCAEGEDCLVHQTSLPFVGTKPGSGWCARQWQKTVASNYTGTISLGSNTEIYVSIKAGPVVRENSGRLNQPAYVALPPPLRARVNCPHHFPLSVKDLDGDRVQCRFAREDLGECVNCTQHSFIELHEEKCSLKFTGKAAAGQYFIYLMAEDWIPVPRTIQLTENKPLSSVPVHLSLTVEESSTSCSDEPVATDENPREDSTLFVMPYQEVKFDINYRSQRESVVEVAVVGPPELFRVDFQSVGPLSTMKMGWVRSENKLARLLPICFAANTKSLQSEPRCVWLYQREMRTLPAGTELKCENKAMTLVLPVTTLNNINLAELQLNSPTCPVTYNSTHLTATISLDGCGTKAVHSGSELVYTNTLKSVHPYTLVRRTPILILPLACRIPGVQAKGPNYKISIPPETETFGTVRYWIEFHLPGEGPMAKFTRIPEVRRLRLAPGRVRREVEPPSESIITIPSSANDSISTSSPNTNSTRSPNTNSTRSPNTHSTSSPNTNPTSVTYNNTFFNFTSGTTSAPVGSKINVLDLHVMSNCTINRAEMQVGNCIQSETADFAESQPILEQGCSSSNSTLEVITSRTQAKIYRLDMSSVKAKGSTMYVECQVNLCITTLPSQKCPDMCTRTFTHRTVIGNVYTKTYTVRSGPVSLVVTTAAPSITTVVTRVATTAKPKTTSIITAPATAAQTTTTSHAPVQASATAAGVISAIICIYLQNVFLY